LAVPLGIRLNLFQQGWVATAMHSRRLGLVLGLDGPASQLEQSPNQGYHALDGPFIPPPHIGKCRSDVAQKAIAYRTKALDAFCPIDA
jgi:hypothetical protein